MKALELRTRSRQELEDMVRELKEKSEALRYDIQRKKLKNVKELGRVRRDIARIMTVMSEKK